MDKVNRDYISVVCELRVPVRWVLKQMHGQKDDPGTRQDEILSYFSRNVDYDDVQFEATLGHVNEPEYVKGKPPYAIRCSSVNEMPD